MLELEQFKITNPYFNVTFTTHVDDNTPELIGWNVTEFNTTMMRFQFNFTEKLEVSSGFELDKIQLTILRPWIFQRIDGEMQSLDESQQ